MHIHIRSRTAEVGLLAKGSGDVNKNISVEIKKALVIVMRVRSINKPLRKSTFVLLIAVLFMIVAVSSQNVTASTQTFIPANADAYVDNSNPNTNYGSSLFLYTHNYTESVAQASAGSGTQNEVGPVVRSWIKFDLSQIPAQATIGSATLRMHTALWGTRSVNIVSVFICEDNSWAESGITWNNAPSKLSANSQSSLECNNPDVDYNFDVSHAVNGKNSVSFVLETAELSKEPAVFNSKDLNPSTGPTLIVNYELPFDLGVVGPIGLGVAVLVVVVVAAVVFRSKKRNVKT